MVLSASIVLYKSDFDDLHKIIESLYSSIQIFLIDNSPNCNSEQFSSFSNVHYYHFPANLGFGAGHNIAMEKAIDYNACYHFIINPDILFESYVINELVDLMNSDNTIGMVMPQILNIDNSVQFLPKLIPNPIDLLIRKFKKPSFYYKEFIDKYELRNIGKNEIINVPIISGCFCLLNLKVIKEIGKYDERFFMYFEDWDLSRRINLKYKTIYYTKASVYHRYKSEANINFKLFLIFLSSAIKYFNKWGWFFDCNRKIINLKVLANLNTVK